MKTIKSVLIISVVITAMFLQSCSKNETEDPVQQNIVPEKFTIDIPNSISSLSYYKDSKVDTLQGNDIYEHLRTFIFVGEFAADMVGDIMLAIYKYNLSQPMTFTFTSESDGRLKQVVIVENAVFEDHTWQYKMTITDMGTSISQEESTAMQVFWDKSPVKGIALLSPYNIDRNTDPKFISTMYRLDYSEVSESGYTNHMIVTIDGLPMEDPITNPYSMSTMKMFVGKNGDVVSVYGNSEHPNAKFFNGDSGFDWAFSAAGKNSTDIGVAEVGLPSNTLNSSDRNTLLVENSIKNVFTQQIYEVWPSIDSITVQSYLYNTEAPGFFDHNGFIQGGTAPSPEYNALLSIIEDLTPYNPWIINQLEIKFD